MVSPLLASVRNTVRTQLWPLPVWGSSSRSARACCCPTWTRVVDARLAAVVDRLLFGGDAGAARTVLDAIVELAHHRHLADVLADGGDAAAGEQPVLAAAAADLHQRHLRAGHPGGVPGHLHLLPDRPARRTQRRRGGRPSSPDIGHASRSCSHRQRPGPGAVPGPPGPADPGRDDAARRPRRRQRHRAKRHRSRSSDAEPSRLPPTASATLDLTAPSSGFLTSIDEARIALGRNRSRRLRDHRLPPRELPRRRTSRSASPGRLRRYRTTTPRIDCRPPSASRSASVTRGPRPRRRLRVAAAHRRREQGALAGNQRSRRRRSMRWATSRRSCASSPAAICDPSCCATRRQVRVVLRRPDFDEVRRRSPSPNRVATAIGPAGDEQVCSAYSRNSPGNSTMYPPIREQLERFAAPRSNGRTSTTPNDINWRSPPKRVEEAIAHHVSRSTGRAMSGRAHRRGLVHALSLTAVDGLGHPVGADFRVRAVGGRSGRRAQGHHTSLPG